MNAEACVLQSKGKVSSCDFDTEILTIHVLCEIKLVKMRTKKGIR